MSVPAVLRSRRVLISAGAVVAAVAAGGITLAATSSAATQTPPGDDAAARDRRTGTRHHLAARLDCHGRPQPDEHGARPQVTASAWQRLPTGGIAPVGNLAASANCWR